MKLVLMQGNKKVAGTLLVLLLLLAPVTAWAEGGAASAANWHQLLNEDYIYQVAASGEHLWLGINGGAKVVSLKNPQLQRFYHKLNSGLQASQVYAVAADGQGGIWFGTDNGAFYLDQYGSWQHFTQANAPFAVKTITAVAVDGSGGVWFGSWGGGAYRLAGEENWQVYNGDNSGLPGNQINVLATDGSGGVWFGTDGQGAAYLDSAGNWQVYNKANSSLPGDEVLDLAVDGSGGVWFATYLGLGHLNSSGEWSNYHSGNSPLPADQVYALARAADDTLWGATYGGLFQVANGELAYYPAVPEELANALINSVTVDRQGTVWSGSWGAGLAALQPKAAPDAGTALPAANDEQQETGRHWQHYGQEALKLPDTAFLPMNTVNAILLVETGGPLKVWFGTGSGLAALEPATGKWHTYSLPGAAAEPPVRALSLTASGSLAVALEGYGVAFLSPQGSWSQLEESQLPSQQVTDMALDKAGGIWLATRDAGAVYLDSSGKGRVFEQESSGLPVNKVNKILVDLAGNTWFGTWGGGVAVLASTGDWQHYHAGNSLLPVDDVTAMAVDQEENLWLATWGGGLVKISSQGEWSLHNTGNSQLPSDIVRDLALDARGWLWAATAGGVAVYKDGSWQQLTVGSTALPVGSVEKIAADSRGNIWLATADNGAFVYNPAGLAGDLLALTGVSQRLQEICILYGDNLLHPDVAPVIEAGRTLVPVRVIFETMGAELAWNQAEKSATAVKGDQVIKLVVDSQEAYVNGEIQVLDVPARLMGQGTLMIPLRFISENFGMQVQWDPLLRAAMIIEAGEQSE